MSEDTLRQAGLFGQGLGVAAGAYGRVASAVTSAEVSRYNALVFDRDAAAARALEPVVRTEAGLEAGRILEQGRDVVGTQAAATGHAGLALAGSPMLVLLDTVRKNAQDAWLARYKGDVSAYRLETEAVSAGTEAALERAQASRQRRAAYLTAGTSILSSLASAGRMWRNEDGSGYLPGV